VHGTAGEDPDEAPAEVGVHRLAPGVDDDAAGRRPVEQGAQGGRAGTRDSLLDSLLGSLLGSLLDSLLGSLLDSLLGSLLDPILDRLHLWDANGWVSCIEW